MTNEDYLKNMKKADEKWFDDGNIDFDQLADVETFDGYRQVKALEIIAETLIGISAKMKPVIITYGQTIKS